MCRLSILSSLLKSAIFLFLAFVFSFCHSNEEFGLDCHSISIDLEKTISQYNSCSSDGDCISIHFPVPGGCIAYFPLTIKGAFQNEFENEVRQLTQNKCIQKGYCCFGGTGDYYYDPEGCMYPDIGLPSGSMCLREVCTLVLVFLLEYVSQGSVASTEMYLEEALFYSYYLLENKKGYDLAPKRCHQTLQSPPYSR